MKMTGKLLVILASIAIGCRKENLGSTTTSSYFKNNSNHKVKITFYYTGVTYPDSILLLNSGDSLKFGYDVAEGLLNQSRGLASKYLSQNANDSIVVTFDNLYSITHYVNTPGSLNTKHYLFASLRNLANVFNWKYTFKDVSKYHRESYLFYYFTEQDYLDAK
jgi:hypothetical protein